MSVRTLTLIFTVITFSASLSGCEVLSDPSFIQAMGGVAQSAGQYKQCLRGAVAANSGAAVTACSNQYNEDTAQQIAQIN
jgi:hypothetical protein